MAAGHPAKGLDQAFAAKLQISPSMWSQIKANRPIGGKLARQIEIHCGASTGWLDEVHEEYPPQPDAAEERFVAAARAAWRTATARGKRELRTYVLGLAGHQRAAATTSPPRKRSPENVSERVASTDQMP